MIRIPFQIDADMKDRTETEEKTETSIQGLHVLLTEDNEQIRSLDDPALAGITLLAMTANAFDEDRKKALACGMDGFLSKPIAIEELISTLQNSLG